MSDNRNVAKKIIVAATSTIMVDRPGVHGSAENSFEMIGDMWTVYLRHCKRVRGNDTIRPEDVAEMMAMLKKARKVYGKSSNEDNDVDDIGYTALAGMLRLPDPEKLPEYEMEENLRVRDFTDEEKRFMGGNAPPTIPAPPIKTKHTNIKAGT